jgi:hypothetical protein
MATLAFPFPQKATVREALSSVRVPQGVVLHSVEFGHNSHGEPAIFVTYAVASANRSDEEQVKVLSDLVDSTLRAIDTLNLAIFAYVNFRSE